jgi:hypothetical protein
MPLTLKGGSVHAASTASVTIKTGVTLKQDGKVLYTGGTGGW